MRISNIRIGESPRDATMQRVSGDIDYEKSPVRRETLWFEVPRSLQEGVSTSANPWLASILPLAAKHGEDIDVEGEIDAAFLGYTRELLEWWRFWFREFSIVSIRPQSIAVSPPSARAATAQFFSGGVDSFFTLLRHIEVQQAPPVDDLLIGWGFDIPLSDRPSFERVTAALSGAAARLDRRLVPFATNFRETRLKELPWGEIGHGNAMAAVAQLLQPEYGRVLIPSTDGYREKGPWGSHATTDHMFSTSGMKIVHDGAAFTRFEKVELVAKSDAALAALRVCWRTQSDENCGHCEKCIRTMIALYLCDALDNAGTFAHASLDLGAVEKIYCPHTETGPFDLYYEEMRDQASRRGRPDLARSISRALRRSRIRQPILDLTERLSWNRYIGPLARPVDNRLRQSIIV